jgi:hypothetical protein
MAGPELAVNQSGNPFVEVFVDDKPAGTSTMRLERVSDNRTWTVRGGVGVAAGVAVLDFEVPFCVPATYRAECFDEGGMSLGFTEPSTTTVWEDRTIVHQPLSPQLWVNPVRLLDTAETTDRPGRGELVRVDGATVDRVIGTGRGGVAGQKWSLLTRRLSDADALQALLGTYEQQQLQVLCIRTPPPMRVPRTFFVSVPTLSERPINVHARGEYVKFDFEGSEVEPPFPGLSEPLLTYDDIDAAYGSYDLADAAYPSYTERDRDYSLAGSA